MIEASAPPESRVETTDKVIVKTGEESKPYDATTFPVLIGKKVGNTVSLEERDGSVTEGLITMIMRKEVDPDRPFRRADYLN